MSELSSEVKDEIEACIAATLVGGNSEVSITANGLLRSRDPFEMDGICVGE